MLTSHGRYSYSPITARRDYTGQATNVWRSTLPSASRPTSSGTG